MTGDRSLADICVSLARSRHTKLFESMQICADGGVKLAEIRLDQLSSEPRLKEILKHRRFPLIATIRRRKDRGQWTGDEEKRLQLLRAAIFEGFDYVDIEMDVARKIPRYGETKRIISHHEMDSMPQELEKLHKRMCRCDADIVKIAATADHPADNLRMFRLIESSSVPTIALCMGDLGVPSRVLGGKFGSPFTYAALNSRRIVAPGMLTYGELSGSYRYESIDEETEIYGVIGDPIGHSLSPLVHNDSFRMLNLNKVYVPFRVPPLCLEKFLKEARAARVEGLSVTIPHKTAVLKIGTAADELVTCTKAANTMLRTPNGYDLYNTDGPAALAALETTLGSPGSRGESPFAGQTVLIIGAGGVARIIAHSLTQVGALVSIAARKSERAQALAREVGCTFVDWVSRNLNRYHILINCTPLGMFPDLLEEMAVHPNALQKGMTVFDTVYNPENTLLSNEAKERGCTIVSGVEMFVRQAEKQFELFTGRKPPEGRMAILVREELSPARKMLRETRRAEEKRKERDTSQ